MLNRSMVALLCALSLVSMTMTSCGDDEEDEPPLEQPGNQPGDDDGLVPTEPEEIPSNALVGTWQSVYVDTWEKEGGVINEDGVYKGPYTLGTLVFTADGTVKETSDGESVTGKYKLIGDDLVIMSDGYESISKVLQLTDEKLIIEYHEVEEEYEYYMKTEYRKVK